MGQRLNVANVSCYVRLKQTFGRPTIRAAQLLVLGANPNITLSAPTMVPLQISDQAGETVYSAKHAISAFANAQQRFQAYVEISNGTFFQVACHISGDLGKAT